MPKRQDIKIILVIGSGPIIIGQACEFDYSGTQACKVLKQEGYKVVLINSNPATIMTDPETADEIYIEPIIPEVIKKIILKEKVDAVLPTIGGQTSLNVTVKIAEDNFFEKHNIKVIGADIKAIKKAEDRQAFKQAMTEIGCKMVEAFYVYNLEEAMKVIEKIEFPVVVRASFTLGGAGGAVAYNMKEYKQIVSEGISVSMINEVVVERSIAGWKEYELEVMKDVKDNVVIICSIENVDPIGIHTGDSITVAPQQTLSDVEYQKLRNMSIDIIRKIGVSTGGANVQFAVHPITNDIRVIEMNPRVSRSSALASKATGFPIAKIAAKLAVGYELNEILNDITQVTISCFEPTIDYVVTKIPKFAFEKFKTASPYLSVQMKSVGETMALGRTFKESFQKAIRGLESNRFGFDGIYFSYEHLKDCKTLKDVKEFVENQKIYCLENIKNEVKQGHFNRIFYIKDLFFLGVSTEEIYKLCKIDKWFLYQLKAIFDKELHNWGNNLNNIAKEELISLKSYGFSDVQLAYFFLVSEKEIRKYRENLSVFPSYKSVDTCAGEFQAFTPYYYSTYDEEDEFVLLKDNKKTIVILGGGPNRIGQGIEFDYMCVQASLELIKLGYRTVMINSNPETVSTDYDVSSLLFFEPLTKEDTLNVIERVKSDGVIIHFGGQTPLNLCKSFEEHNVPILGTSFKTIRIVEDRENFTQILDTLSYQQPENAIAKNENDLPNIIKKIGYPLLVRPSYVLGGRAMEIVYSDKELYEFYKIANKASVGNPVLIDKYIENAKEIDVDLICDGTNVVICGIMEHIEEAGIHSGDSACILPPQSISDKIIQQIEEQSKVIALKLKVIGLMNIQFALKNEELFFLEANPRGSRTIPFVSKASGIAWVKTAVKVIVGGKLSKKDLENGFNQEEAFTAVKEAIIPFDRFPNEDIILGPEMKSTGEVMGVGRNIYEAFYKAEAAGGISLPVKGGVLISIKTKDAEAIIPACETLVEMGFNIYATEGTLLFLTRHGIKGERVFKLGEGRPDVRDKIIDNKINLIFNTPKGREAKESDKYIRLLAKDNKIKVFTNIGAIIICVNAIKELKKHKEMEIYSINNIHKSLNKNK